MSGKLERQPPAERERALTDEQAVRLWQQFLTGANPAGDAAFEELYASFLPRVVRYCYFRLGDLDAADDAAHTVFVRLLKTRPTLETSFIGLLLGTARHLCATEQSTRRPFSVPDPPPPGRDLLADDPAGGIERQEVSTALADCIARLSERDRNLVVLRYGEDLTYRQIRNMLGLRVVLSSLSRRLKAAMGQLRGCLKEKNIFDAQTGRQT